MHVSDPYLSSAISSLFSYSSYSLHNIIFFRTLSFVYTKRIQICKNKRRAVFVTILSHALIFACKFIFPTNVISSFFYYRKKNAYYMFPLRPYGLLDWMYFRFLNLRYMYFFPANGNGFSKSYPTRKYNFEWNIM